MYVPLEKRNEKVARIRKHAHADVSLFEIYIYLEKCSTENCQR